MSASSTKEDRLDRVGRESGPRRLRGVKADWQIEQGAEGWLSIRRPFAVPNGQDPLTLHDRMAGPTKLALAHGRVEQRVEFFLDRDHLAAEADHGHAGTSHEPEAWIGEMLRLALRFFEGRERVEGWQPPTAEVLAGWLTEAGHETAIDREQNLRLTLKKRGCDGQVRVERGDGRLRLMMPLGAWDNLEIPARDAMRRLVDLANARDRLVRFAWLPEGKSLCCQAQVDLSGLPTGTEPHSSRDQLWRSMLRLAVGGLELALRQLALELPLLADPRNRDLAELI